MAARTPLVTAAVAAVFGLVLLGVNGAGDPANRVAGRPAAVAEAAVPAASAPPATVAPPRTAAATPVRAYAGRAQRGGLTVAIAVKGDRALAYLCDDRGVEFWLSGAVTGSDLALRSKDGAATLSGTMDETRSTGSVAIGGAPVPYVAAAVAELPAAAAKALEGRWST